MLSGAGLRFAPMAESKSKSGASSAGKAAPSRAKADKPVEEETTTVTIEQVVVVAEVPEGPSGIEAVEGLHIDEETGLPEALYELHPSKDSMQGRADELTAVGYRLVGQGPVLAPPTSKQALLQAGGDGWLYEFQVAPPEPESSVVNAEGEPAPGEPWPPAGEIVSDEK